MIVDARNSLRSRWPMLVVFDGRTPGGGETALDERTTVVGTGGCVADD